MSTRQPNEDLFDDTRMSFGQHIEELRKCLVKALYGLAVASIIGFMYADEIVSYLQTPLEDAIREYDQKKAKAQLIEKYGYFDPEFDQLIEEKKQAPETVLVDPEQLRAILGMSPAAVEEDERLLKLDVKDGMEQQIANYLLGEKSFPADAEDRENKTKRLAALREEMTKDELQSLRSSLGGSREQLNRRLRGILGRVAIESRLYEGPAFDELVNEQPKGWLSFLTESGKENPLPQMKQRLEEEEKPGALARKLNRALIGSVFTDEFAIPEAKLVSLEIWRTVKVETQSLTPHEPFMIWMKAGLFAALILASPWILYQLWTFVSAGLYPHEKRYVHWYLPISILLFFAGVSLAFFLVLSPVLGFLFEFNATMGITPQLRINYWLSFIMYLPIGFGVAFQLPLVMLVLNRLGILEIGVYLSKWRIAIMVIFVVSMLLTPADPLSMIMLAVPLTILYFFGIALCKWMPRNQNPFGEVYEPT